MAKKMTKFGINSNSTPPSPAKTTTPVRSSAVPKSTGVGTPGQITREMIAKRAYAIWKSGKGGSDFENWLRAERELRGM